MARLAGGGGPRVVLLGHHDTVFPAGSAARLGFAVRDGRAFGPGVADMKGGLLLGLAAMEALAAGERRFAAVDFVSVPDEETRPAGPPAGFDRIRGADACLVLECARENGDLVYQRKAQASLTLVAHGRGAHAGTHPERGRSALLALCREALRVDTLGGARPGLTITVGTFHSGTHFATVPDRAEADVDVRAWDADDVGWALEQVRDTGVHDGVSFDVGQAFALAGHGADRGLPGPSRDGRGAWSPARDARGQAAHRRFERRLLGRRRRDPDPRRPRPDRRPRPLSGRVHRHRLLARALRAAGRRHQRRARRGGPEHAAPASATDEGGDT